MLRSFTKLDFADPCQGSRSTLLPSMAQYLKQIHARDGQHDIILLSARLRANEFQTGFVHSNFRIFYRPVKATAQDGSKLPNIGLHEAAAGTDWQREEPNATLRNLSPATQMSVKTRQMTLRQEESQFSGIGPD